MTENKLQAIHKDLEEVITMKKEQFNSEQFTDPNKIRRLLLLNTGGTYGMDLVNGELKVGGPKSLENKMKKLPVFFDKSESFLYGGKSLVTNIIEGTVFIYDIHQLDQIIDSAESNPAFMIEISEVIRRYFSAYDCFLIIHGTDTMEHTAAYLSFCISNLTKPIVITGSQIPLSNIVNDAYRNLLGCFRILGKLSSEVFHPGSLRVFQREPVSRQHRAKNGQQQIWRLRKHHAPAGARRRGPAAPRVDIHPDLRPAQAGALPHQNVRPVPLRSNRSVYFELLPRGDWREFAVQGHNL